MAIQHDIVSGSAGIGAWLLSLAGVIQPLLAIAVGAASLVALLYSIRLKRRQLKESDK